MAIQNKVKEFIRLFRPYEYSALRRYLEPRRFHAFCVGTNKSGTHSVASMFEQNYRAAHETDHGRLISSAIAWKSDQLSQDKFINILKDYDKFSWLELDSSHVHIEYLELLLELYPQSKFILTIRDCYSWADSCFNHFLNYQLYEPWKNLHDWRYGQIIQPYGLEQEKILSDHGLYALENYFIAWKEHNNKALQLIPEDRLLVVKTFEIKKSTTAIADFLDIPTSSINIQQSHSFKAPQKHNLLSKIEREYIREKAQIHCQELMDKFFNDRDYLDYLLDKNK